MKKIVALILSLVMILALATAAFGTGKSAVIINSPLNAPEGYTVEKLPDGSLIAVPPADVVTETPADTAATADTNVESPKTFDVGVATYVAMSLAAVTGSAVVLKKKD